MQIEIDRRLYHLLCDTTRVRGERKRGRIYENNSHKANCLCIHEEDDADGRLEMEADMLENRNPPCNNIVAYLETIVRPSKGGSDFLNVGGMDLGKIPSVASPGYAFARSIAQSYVRSDRSATASHQTEIPAAWLTGQFDP